MKRLEGYLLELRESGRDAFVEAHPYGFLLMNWKTLSGGPWGDFHTDSIHSGMAKLASQLTREEAEAAKKSEEYRVLELTKSPDSPWRGRISIGRARNTDVVVTDASVSKLHAHISEAKGTLTLTDAGSRNGTKLNGETLKPSKPAELASGDRIHFGTVEVTFYTSDNFADFIGAILRPT